MFPLPGDGQGGEEEEEGIHGQDQTQGEHFAFMLQVCLSFAEGDKGHDQVVGIGQSKETCG